MATARPATGFPSRSVTIASISSSSPRSTNSRSLRSPTYSSDGWTRRDDAAVQAWRFEPATADGIAVPMRIDVPFNFNVPAEQRLNAMFQRKLYQAIPEPVLAQKEFGKRLKVVQKIVPKYPPALLRQRVRVDEKIEVRFVVGPDGRTYNPEILGKPRREFALPTLAAIASASYEPPVKDGKPVYVQMTTTVRFSPPAPPANRGGGGGGGGGGDFGGGGGGD